MPTVKYGLQWGDEYQTDLEIEFGMIRLGAERLKSLGTDLFTHYRNAQSLLWPEDDHHRWSDLILRTFCEEEITILLGCSDSSKTYSMSKLILVDYWTFPDETLWLVSTTEGRGSELRIWGVIKDLFNSARRRYEFLVGSPLDYLKTITTEEIDEDRREARSLRLGVIIVPCKTGGIASGLSAYIGIKSPRLRHAGDEVACFESGTLIDSPSGLRKVETLMVGDEVVCAAGIQKIIATHTRVVRDLVEIKMSDGSTMRCTPEHRFFTTEGWQSAIDIPRQTRLISVDEAMQIVSEEIPPVGKSGRFLLKELRREMALAPAVLSRSDETPGFFQGGQEHKSGNLGESERSEAPIRLDAVAPGDGTIRNCQKELDKKTSQWRKSFWKQWEWDAAVSSGTKDNYSDSLAAVQSGNSLSQIAQRWLSALLQTGLRVLGLQAGNRDRWRNTFSEKADRERQTKDLDIERAWVESITLLKSGGDSGNRKSKTGYRVHNLSVAGHPSYGVNGFLVHNCMTEGFLNAYANWYGKEDFKGIMSGNFMEIDDPLGIAAEPEGGWDQFVDTGKTQTWRTKFYDAKAVALDGRDSPNFDFPISSTGRPRYPYMIGHKKLDATLKTHGADSWQWHSQCVGKPAKGMDIWRVLTRDFCKNRNASEDVIWIGEPLTDLYSLDPAYGGGDRCVGRHLQMGKDLDGVQILMAHPPEIIPIKFGTDKDAEAQIAAYIFNRLKELRIPARNCFYDSFGRGTLGFEFARFFGMECPEPVDSSAMPTTRPVRFDLYVTDRDGKQRLKRCDEHYKKFITELYFSGREAIDSGQIRGLDAETIREGCSRKFTKLPDGKIELETKDDYKERNRGRSPDFMDNWVIGVEGARRRGLKIIRLGKDVQDAKPKKPSDLLKWLEEKSEWEQSHELQKL